MTHQKRIVVHGARLVAGGMMLPQHIVEQLLSMGVDIRCESIVGKTASIAIVDEPQPAGIVTDIDAHQRAMSTPFFNDLAG